MLRLLPLLPLRRPRPLPLTTTLCSHPLSTTPAGAAKHKQMPSRPKPPPEDEIDEMFVKGTGPGGQKILRHIPTGIVVKSQATRSRSENRAIARGLLAARLDEIRNPETSRTAALVAAKLKKRANATKKARRKYKKLAGAKDGEVGEGEGEEEEEALTEGQEQEQELDKEDQKDLNDQDKRPTEQAKSGRDGPA